MAGPLLTGLSLAGITDTLATEMEELNKLQFPYEFQELTSKEKKLCEIYLPAFDLISVGPKKYKELRTYIDDAANIYNMPVRTSDTFVTSYQRSGTTWTQELVWLLANNLDYAAAAAEPLTDRYKFLEMYTFMGQFWNNKLEKMEGVEKEEMLKAVEYTSKPISKKLLSMPSPRFIKTHLPMSLLPPTLLDSAKVVYVARDPRDVAVSSFHHGKSLAGFGMSAELPKDLEFKDFWNLFTKDLFLFTPYFEHVKEAWALRHHPNMLFLFYEELATDLPKAVQRVAAFLGKKELTTKQMTHLCDHLSIANFKKNKSVNIDNLTNLGKVGSISFIRNGKTGGWTDYFDEQMMEQMERWMAENLQGSDLQFPQ